MGKACPACGRQAPADARFCPECGEPLADRCPECRSVLPPNARFCPQCGTALRRPGPPASAERPAPAESPSRDELATEGELRQLTVVFSDLVGSTELSARIDPEEFSDVLGRYQERAGGAVRRYGGTVLRYLGDGMLVYFGWPEAHDDDAERAVRAALDVAHEVEALNAELPAEIELAVRVGVHTGPVVIGEIGAGGDPRETMALGETVNLAARLQGVAAPDTVVMTAATLGLVPGIFVTEALGEFELKGIAAPVPVYRAVQPSGVRSRLDALRGRLTRLADREAELGLLLDRWQRSRERIGQTVLIMGEPGVGKSRLVYELRERMSDAAHSWLECSCSSYTQHSAFRPAVEVIEQGLVLRPDDDDEERLAKLERGLARVGLRDPDVVPLLAGLLGIPAPGSDASTMSPDVRRRRTIELLAGWVLSLAALQPMVLLVEDLHWCDPSSLELFERLMTAGAQCSLLVVATARPEFDAASWAGRANVTTLALTPLSEVETRDVLDGVSGGLELPETVVERVVGGADGIPLFAEEMGRMVLDSGMLVERSGRLELVAPLDELEIPMTLQDSLMARLDRLSAAKRVAQRAAVVGRAFDYALLEEVAELEPDILRHGLLRLVEDGLLFQQGEPPDATYTFRHALIRDAAYRSVLRRNRTALHARIAKALERREAVGAPASPEVAARHYEAAGLAEEAVAAYKRAAEHTARHSAHQESIEHLRRAIALLDSIPDEEKRQALEVDLQMALGSSVMAARGYADAEVERAYERARALCDARGEAKQAAYALIGLAIFHFNRGEAARGEELAAGALEIARREQDDTLRLLARVQLAVPILYQGRFAESLEHADDAASVYRPEEHAWVAFRYGTDQGVAAHCLAALALAQLGHPDRALARVEDGARLARELGNPFNVVYALFFESVIQWCRGDPAAQERAAEQLVAIAEEQGFTLFVGNGQMFHAAARATMAADESAIGDFMEGAARTASTGSMGGAPALVALLAEAQRAAGKPEDALVTVDGGLTVSAQTGQPYWDAELHRLRAELLLELERDDVAAVETELRAAIEIARGQGARWQELRAARSLARVMRERGDGAQAERLLRPVYESFAEGFETPDLAEAAELLGMPVADRDQAAANPSSG
jgi:class 3 adenylate cyclase/predicted ATPase